MTKLFNWSLTTILQHIVICDIFFFIFYFLLQIEKIMNLIGAGIETSIIKQPMKSSGKSFVSMIELIQCSAEIYFHRYDHAVCH